MASGKRGADKRPRKKRAPLSTAQKKDRAKKLAATKKEKSQARLASNNAAMGSFIQMMAPNKPAATEESGSESTAGDEVMQDASHEVQMEEDVGNSPANDEPNEEEIIVTFSDTITETICHVIEGSPIVANLDIDDDEDPGYDDDDDDDSIHT